jgi:hypothetical protein
MSAPLPASALVQARSTPIERVVEERGIKLRGKTERAGPCPRCGGTDRFGVNVKKQLFYCRNCDRGGDVIELVQFLDGCDFREAVETLAGERRLPSEHGEPYRAASVAKAAPGPSQCDDDAKHDLARAARYVAEMRPLISEPRALAYFERLRKIDVAAIADVLKRTDAIGWHGSVYFKQSGHPLHGQRLGAIIGVMTDAVTAEPTGAISRTYLAPDGTKVGPAKTLGAPAGIVHLSPDDEVLEGLFLAEGLETALSGMAIGLRPMWATGTRVLIGKFPVLSGVEALNVIVDHDHSGAGERAAREVETRWRAAGREVNLLRSDAPGDLNDALKGGSP